LQILKKQLTLCLLMLYFYSMQFATYWQQEELLMFHSFQVLIDMLL